MLFHVSQRKTLHFGDTSDRLARFFGVIGLQLANSVTPQPGVWQTYRIHTGQILLPVNTLHDDAHLPTDESRAPASDSSAIPAELSDRFKLFTTFFDQLYMDKDVYTFADKVVLRWPQKLQAPADYTARLQKVEGQRIYAEATGKEGDNGDRTFAPVASLPDGDYEVILMPGVNEYYHQGIRIQRKIPLSIVRSAYQTAPYGTYTERLLELLRHATTLEDGLFSELAKMALGWWEQVKLERIIDNIEAVNQQPHSLLRLLGLLGMRYRFGKHAQFPTAIRQPLDDCMCGFLYQDAANREENATAQLLLYTCEILAGQHYPQRRFCPSNENGNWHQRHGEAAALRWLQHAASHGFPDTSSHSLAQMLVALSHLVDLSDSEQIWELAAIVMDKVLVTMALDSFQGFYTDEGDTPVLSGHLSPLAGIERLLWGMGTWNQHLAGPISLACCENYAQPALIAGLAAARPAGMWATERHSLVDDRTVERAAPTSSTIGQGDSHANERMIHKAIYKTSDFLLGSAQSQRSQPGQSWQATLGPDALVFVNHPSTSAADAPATDYWRAGQQPRVAQHQDTLIALYRLPADDPFGYTHAYFPTFAFDEQQVGKMWTFAAKGDAYIALACSQPLVFVRQGQRANRELQAHGHEIVWLCQMGSKAAYGSFANFRKHMLGARLTFQGLSVFYRKLQGDTLTFGWDEALCINHKAQPLPSAKHYDGPYCVTDGWPASKMMIVYDKQAVQLDLTPMATSD